MDFVTRQLRIVPSVTLIMLLASVIGTACGPNVIKGRPPFVSIATMNLTAGHLATEFRIDNQNELAMNIEAFEVSVIVDSVRLTREARDLELLIDANSTEEILVEEAPSDDVSRLLGALERREVNSLPFELNGQVRTLEDGILRFEQKGHLYPVPGKPGFFRRKLKPDELQKGIRYRLPHHGPGDVQQGFNIADHRQYIQRDAPFRNDLSDNFIDQNKFISGRIIVGQLKHIDETGMPVGRNFAFQCFKGTLMFGFDANRPFAGVGALHYGVEAV